MTERDLEQMQQQEDEAYAELIPALSEYECLDMECGHYDGDGCSLGGCYDPSPSPEWLAYNDSMERGDMQREDLFAVERRSKLEGRWDR